MPSTATLVAVSCDFCGSDLHRTICIRPDARRVVECCRCGLAFLNPRPAPDKIHAIYQQGYFAGGDRIGYTDYFASVPRGGHFAELDVLERYVDLRGKRLLEAGCAAGPLLADARKRGASVTGVDISVEAAAIARSQYSFDVRVGALEDLCRDYMEAFDIAVACEVIEHVLNPSSFLKSLASVVRPGGHVLLTTPNYRCARQFGEAWFGFQTSFEHLYFFSNEVLSRMAAKAGLHELCWFTRGPGVVTHHPATAPLKWLARKLRLESPARRLKMSLRSTPEYIAHGQGHTLLMIFRKTGPLTASGHD